jgi:hypothetical protein
MTDLCGVGGKARQERGQRPKKQRLQRRTGNGKGNDQGKIRGSLHCATDDDAVRRFGRDDGSFALQGEG